MLAAGDAVPNTRHLVKAEFAPLRLPLIKIAAWVTETARCVLPALAACHSDAELFAGMLGALIPPDP